jgi:hypothetical protein
MRLKIKSNVELSQGMKAERTWLSQNAPTFGRVAGEGYGQRAKAFNQELVRIGAPEFKVVEG